MKKLILIQNDYPGTGKSTLSLCLTRHLEQYGVDHRLLSLVEEGASATPGSVVLDPDSLTPRVFMAHVDASPITILEVGTGLGEFFNTFYQEHEFENILHETGVAVTVVLPVTADRESFDSVTQAAEIYSDNAEYLIAHLVTSSYDEDDKIWDTSYAARIAEPMEKVAVAMAEKALYRADVAILTIDAQAGIGEQDARIAGLVQGLAEAIAFGQRAGLDMPLVLDVIGKGAAQSWQMDNRGKTMVDNQFNFGFAVDWMRKDLGLVMDEARRNGARVPVTALVDQFYADVQAAGGQRFDTSSLITRLK